MSNERHTNLGIADQHPTDDELLCFIDGEQSREETEVIQFHLKACWSCRVRAEKLNNVISTFVEFRGQIIKPAVKIPDNRGNFNMRLNRAVAETKVELSLLARWWSHLKRSLNIFISRTKSIASAKARILKSISTYPVFNLFNDERHRRLITISGATLLIFSLLLTHLFWLPTYNPVSAEELLDKASAAREAQIKNQQMPVVYQQMQIKYRTAAGDESISKAEFWQDETNARVRQISISGKDDSKSSTRNRTNSNAAKSNLNLLTGLQKILEVNDFVPAQPFSVAGFRSWRNSLSGKTETVEEDKTSDVLRIKTEAAGEIELGKLLSTTLAFRSSDHHAVEQIFVVQTADGAEEYVVRETSFAVISLNNLSPNFFESQPEISVARHSAPKPEPSASTVAPTEDLSLSPDSKTAAADSPTLNVSIASAELEVKVLELLHQVGADLGEQIEVVRESQGPVKVSGIVETAARKKQIVAALSSVSGNPAVKINIQTVDEAVAAEQQKKSGDKVSSSPPTVQMEMRRIEGVSFPAEAEVREYFARQGTTDDEVVRDYAARMTTRSTQAMRFLYALKRLKNQMKAEDFAKLTPDARAKLLGLIKSYAGSYESEIAVLRRDLRLVFGNGSATGSEAAINSDTELLAAIDRLFDAGTASNRAVSNSLATGNGRNTLRTPEFWRNLAAAETIAKRLQSVN